MTVTLKTETPEVNTGQSSVPAPMDNIDAMLRGRYSQEPFAPWLLKRIRNVYPK